MHLADEMRSTAELTKRAKGSERLTKAIRGDMFLG